MVSSFARKEGSASTESISWQPGGEKEQETKHSIMRDGDSAARDLTRSFLKNSGSTAGKMELLRSTHAHKNSSVIRQPTE